MKVVDLEAAGIGIIQIERPAFLKVPCELQRNRPYLDWRKRFRLSASGYRRDSDPHTYVLTASQPYFSTSIAAIGRRRDQPSRTQRSDMGVT